MEGRIGRESGGADHRPPQVELVEQALLQGVGDRREARELLAKVAKGKRLAAPCAARAHGAAVERTTLAQLSFGAELETEVVITQIPACNSKRLKPWI